MSEPQIDLLTGKPWPRHQRYALHPYRSCECGHRHGQRTLLINHEWHADDTRANASCPFCPCSDFRRVGA